MQEFTARQIVAMPREEVWRLYESSLEESYAIRYEDGITVITPGPHLLFNRYVWELFTLHPKTPIPSTCNMLSIDDLGCYNADTHIRLLETVFRHICQSNGILYYQDKEPMTKKVYEIIDLLHNEVVLRISAHVSTIDATDFVNVIQDPLVVSMQENFRPTAESVDRAYKETRNYMTNASGNNRFVAAYRSKSINDKQANQCIGPRGFMSDLGRTVFRKPIGAGFIRGMETLYDMMTESLTAAKSLNANEKNISDSEYASRRIQILTMVVQRVVNGDCGSTNYAKTILTPALLEAMQGKYYLTEAGTLSAFTGSETHLLNTEVQVRSVFGCTMQNSTRICSCCLGQIAHNFKENSNLGYTFTAFLMEKITQAIMSTKHLTHSVKKSAVKLEGLANKYLYANEDGDLFFHRDVDLTGLHLVLPNSSLSKLVDVLNLSSKTNVDLARIGEIEEVIVRDTRTRVPTNEKLYLAYKDRLCIITRALLEHIRDSEHESDSRGNFIVPLEKFDKTKPIFNNPLKEANIVAFAKRIASVIETDKDKIADPQEKLHLLLDTVAERFKMNYSILEVLVYATTAFNPLNGNYKLGRNSSSVVTEKSTELFRHRDFAALGVYQGQNAEIYKHSIYAFSNVKKQNHPMAVFFAPQQAIDVFAQEVDV